MEKFKWLEWEKDYHGQNEEAQSRLYNGSHRHTFLISELNGRFVLDSPHTGQGRTTHKTLEAAKSQAECLDCLFFIKVFFGPAVAQWAKDKMKWPKEN
jgi:hypothetical protein